MELERIFEQNYEDFRVSGFESKYLPFLDLKNYLNENYPSKKLIGKSFLGNDIYALKIGSGEIQILAWSQMHGNESTGTRAMLDVFSFLNSDHPLAQELKSKVSFHFIPMLNPDGASTYSRRNACGIDLNRDFIAESSPEIRILKNYVREIKPQFLFNLHDQRSIFNVGTLNEPATLAFLSPSADLERSINPNRIASMAVIDHMCKGLRKFIPHNVARFSDEFYPTSTGDNFMKLGYPTILFEAGHYPNDYPRNKVRKYNALAILLALEKIADRNWENEGGYFEIPENNKRFMDILLRNVLVKSNEAESLIDIGIYFEERLNLTHREIEFVARIEEIGDMSSYYGHLEIDKKGKAYIGKSSMYPVIGEYADFSVGNIHFEKGKFLS
jgi:hypothetical protein